MVLITVVLCTIRDDPQFGWALESLQNQTFSDFEYIIVDSLYSARNDAVKKLIDSYSLSFPIRYIKDKQNIWGGKRPALCNARNTALIFANGKYIVFHDDNCKMPHDWLERHLVWLEQGYLVAGSWTPYEREGVTCNRPDTRFWTVKKPQIVSGGWLYGSNFSFPLRAAEEINGFDESYDGEMGQDDIDFGIRIERKGYQIMYDPTCRLNYYYANHRPLMKDLVSATAVLKDGTKCLPHQLLIQNLLDNSDRYLPSGNQLNLSELRIDKIHREEIIWT